MVSTFASPVKLGRTIAEMVRPTIANAKIESQDYHEKKE